MMRGPFAALAQMNFSSPDIALPHRLSVAENFCFYGHLHNVRNVEARIAELSPRNLISATC
jgi:ABC-2 type transport system ATP-binding protein